jgi:hypothetical protein
MKRVDFLKFRRLKQPTFLFYLVLSLCAMFGGMERAVLCSGSDGRFQLEFFQDKCKQAPEENRVARVTEPFECFPWVCAMRLG